MFEQKAAAVPPERVGQQQVIEQTVRGLGFDPIEVERSAGGLLRVTIDVPWPPAPGAAESVSIEDCERVSRQLQYALEVEGVDYRRLEVSSPGIDRPLRHAADFERFEGERVEITLKEPIGAAASGSGVAANRKKFVGALQRGAGSGWELVWSDAPAPKPGVRVNAKRAAAPQQVLGFELDELQSARLAQQVDFKGRAPRGAKTDGSSD